MTFKIGGAVRCIKEDMSDNQRIKAGDIKRIAKAGNSGFIDEQGTFWKNSSFEPVTFTEPEIKVLDTMLTLGKTKNHKNEVFYEIKREDSEDEVFATIYWDKNGQCRCFVSGASVAELKRIIDEAERLTSERSKSLFCTFDE